jgi:hypothetical protein
MTWANDHRYDGTPLEFERLRRLEDLDASSTVHGFFDPDRAERWDDYTPSLWWSQSAAARNAHTAGLGLTPAHEQPSHAGPPVCPSSGRSGARAVAADWLHEGEDQRAA